MGKFEDDGNKVASHRLIHHVFELNLLTYQVDCSTSFAEQIPIELNGLNILLYRKVVLVEVSHRFVHVFRTRLFIKVEVPSF